MPKLRDETYAARRQHILDAARACFSRKGFHAASMMDLQAEAGVSAGAIYVYFPSKRDIVAAITEENLDLMTAALEQALASDPASSLREAVTAAVKVTDRVCDGPTRGIAFDVWGEAGRDPEIGALVDRRLGGVRDLFTAVARRAIENGELPAGADPKALGAVLFGLCVPGYYTQKLTIGVSGPGAYVDAALAAVIA